MRLTEGAEPVGTRDIVRQFELLNDQTALAVTTWGVHRRLFLLEIDLDKGQFDAHLLDNWCGETSQLLIINSTTPGNPTGQGRK